MGRWANSDGASWTALGQGALCAGTYAGPVEAPGQGGYGGLDRPARPSWGIGRELDRLRQLRGLSVNLAQACTIDDIVDTLSVRVAADCGAETSVVYLMDPDQEDVLRLAAARGLPGGGSDPAVLCRDGGALIARAVRARQPQLSVVRDPTGAVTTAVACPLLLRAEPLGAFAYGFPGNFGLDGASHEFLLGASGLVALALDRTAATERAREAQQTSEYMTTVLRRIFGGEQKTLA
jgi:GAF domain-containing protein